MEQTKTGYGVLSIRELKNMLRVAKEQSRSRYNGKVKEQSTICLHNLRILSKDYDIENESQVSFTRVTY